MFSPRPTSVAGEAGEVGDVDPGRLSHVQAEEFGESFFLGGVSKLEVVVDTNLDLMISICFLVFEFFLKNNLRIFVLLCEI